MQRFGTLVSAAGQGEQAGPQSSSSSDRSSSLVGNLASEGFNVTRNSSTHECNKSANEFCYVCGKYEIQKNRRNLSESLKLIYRDCFGVDVENQDKNWAPKTICNSCRIMLTRWAKNPNVKLLQITKPVEWSESTSEDDCYFCITNTEGHSSRTKNTIKYANVSSVKTPVSVENVTKMGDELMDIDNSLPEEEMQIDESSNGDSSSESDDEYIPHGTRKSPEKFDQKELNDLIRDLGLPKDGAEYLAAVLKKKHLLSQGTKSCIYRNREKEFRKFYAKDTELSLTYCTDVEGVINELKPNCYKAEEWRLFIDSSKRSLKAVLLHNGNTFAPIPIAHSTKLKETYENLQIVLNKIKYTEHKWKVCGDLKIITILLGQQSGFTKFPCFLCLWDSRARDSHYVQKIWPERTDFEPGSKNIIRIPLVDSSVILLPPLHIKLGLMKQFVKALDKDGDCFEYLGEKFPEISDAKLKEGIFDGPQIRTMFNDDTFITKMTNDEKEAWLGFKKVAQNFLGNHKSEDYQNIVEKMLESYKQLGCLMNLKLHFLHSHLDYFPANLGDYSEEHGERFHQDIKEMERRYQGKWDVNMMADFCWMLKRETKAKGKKRKRNPLHRTFEDSRVRYKRTKV